MHARRLLFWRCLVGLGSFVSRSTRQVTVECVHRHRFCSRCLVQHITEAADKGNVLLHVCSSSHAHTHCLSHLCWLNHTDCMSVVCPRACECRYTLKLTEIRAILINETSTFLFLWNFRILLVGAHHHTTDTTAPHLPIDAEFLPKPHALELVGAIRKLVPDAHNSQTPTVAYVATWPNLPILARTSTPTTRSSEPLSQEVAEPGVCTYHAVRGGCHTYLPI